MLFLCQVDAVGQAMNVLATNSSKCSIFSILFLTFPLNIYIFLFYIDN